MTVRYRADGSLDPSFGEGGLAYVQPRLLGPEPQNDRATATAVAVEPDGGILVGGTYDPDLGAFNDLVTVLVRLNSDGSLDFRFGGKSAEGMVIGSARRSLRAIALQGAGILVGGEGVFGDGYIARYRIDGTRDSTFAGGRAKGVAHIGAGRAKAGVTDLIEVASGLYAAGYLDGDFMLARLRKNGRLDPRFGGDGIVTTNPVHRKGCGCSVATGLVQDGRGRLLVSGLLTSRRLPGAVDPEAIVDGRVIAVARYTAAGSLDRRFGRGGIAAVPIGSSAHAGKIALLRSGGIAVAGDSRGSKGRSLFTAVRLRADGSRERAFHDDGVFRATFGAFSSYAHTPLADGHGMFTVLGGLAIGASGRQGTGGLLLARFAESGNSK